MTWVHPRPAAETNTWARQNLAYPGLLYRIPLSIGFGSFPFHVTVSGAAWLSVVTTGSYTGTSHSLWLEGTCPNDVDGTTYNITLTAYDQEYNRGANPSSPITVSYTITVDSTKFKFVDAVNGLDTNSGTLASPWKTMNGWYESDKTLTTYSGHIIYYRAGTYYTSAWDATASAVRMDNAAYSKPYVHLSYPGERAVFDVSSTRFAWSVNINDIYMDVDWTNSVNQSSNPDTAISNNAHCILMGSAAAQGRCVFLGDWSNLGRGNVGTDNPAGVEITWNGDAAYKQYITIRGTMSGTNTAPMFDFYGVKNVVVEDVKLSTGSFNTTSQILFFKANYNDITVRLVNGYVPTYQGDYGVVEFWDFIMASSSTYCYNIELQYSYINMDTSLGTNSGAVVYNWTNVVGQPVANMWCQRNTIVGNVGLLDQPINLYADGNVFVDPSPLPASGTYRTIYDGTTVTNLKTVAADGAITASTGNLTASYQAANLGLRGWQIQ